MKEPFPPADSTTTGLTRRDVLRGLGGLIVAGPAILLDSPAHAAGGHSLIPAVPNLAQAVAGVQAYAQNSVHAGDAIDFRVSSTVPYQLSVARLGWDTESPSKDWTVHSFPQAPALQRFIRPGSYVHVERALPSAVPQSQLTLECWVRPFRLAWQGLITQYDYPNQAGFGLFLADDGRPVLYMGNGGAFNAGFLRYFPSAIPISPIRQWTHLCVVFNAGVASLYVDGANVAIALGLPATVTPGGAPLRLGAYGQDGTTRYFLDGDLAMPALYDRALPPVEVAQRAVPNAPTAANSLGCWPLDEERGYSVRDVSTSQRDGIIVNRGTWMVGGPGFHAENVPRFDPYDPDTDAGRGHALRLSSSDLFDCAWPVSHSYTLPSDLLPGVYVGRILHSGGARYDVTFVVKKAVNRPAAPILVLCATNTWHAYNAAFDLFSFYSNHAGGQPGYYVGVNMPWSSAADPYIQYLDASWSYSHLLRAERLTHVWLEQNGYDYDVVSDRDLHNDPALLFDYSAVLVLGHSEYWSREAYDGIRDYLAGGGKLIVASGNTMFWRVSFDDEVIECRKLPETVGGRPNAQYGELYHEHDHERGGLMREAGLPAWRAIGLECIGYTGDRPSAYQVTNPTHAFFQSPESIAVSIGTEIGGQHSVGHEWDARVQTIPGPYNPPLPPEYDPIVLAEGRGNQNRLHYQADWIAGANQVISEIVDWPWSGGGRVLAAGSIAAGVGLHDDEKMSALFRNALHHFGIRHRVDAMAIGLDGHFNHKWFDGSSWGPSFGGWEDMGGGFGSHAPIGVMWAPDRISVMAISATGGFLYRDWNGSAWSSWSLLGSGFTGRPAAVGWGRNRLQLFARGTNGNLYEDAWNGSSWSGWNSLGSGATSDPSAISWEGNHLAVATLGATGQVLYKWYSNGAWGPTPTGWQDMGGTFARAPTLFAWNGNFINIFAVDASGAVYHKHWNGETWWPSLTGWDYLGGSLASRVVVGSRGRNDFTLFGIGTDGRLKAKWWDWPNWGPSYTGWQDLGGDLIGEPAVASYRGKTLSVMAVGSDARAKHLLWDGSTWSAWQDMGGSLRASPALIPWIGRPGSTTVPIDHVAQTTALGVGFLGLLIARRYALQVRPAD